MRYLILSLLCFHLLPAFCSAQKGTIATRGSYKATVGYEQRHVTADILQQIMNINTPPRPVVIEYYENEETLTLAKELKAGLENVHYRVIKLTPLDATLPVNINPADNFSYRMKDTVLYITAHQKVVN